MNSREYDFCDIKLFLLGRFIEGLRGIDYKIKQAKTPLYGAGRFARGTQFGKIEVEGTLTILQSDLIAMERAAVEAGYDNILGLTLDIIVSYVSTSLIVATDKIVGVTFSEIPRGMKVDDAQMEVALPFVATRVLQNII